MPKEFIQLFQKTKEFRDLSLMAIGEIFREIEVIDLYREDDGGCENYKDAAEDQHKNWNGGNKCEVDSGNKYNK